MFDAFSSPSSFHNRIGAKTLETTHKPVENVTPLIGETDAGLTRFNIVPGMYSGTCLSKVKILLWMGIQTRKPLDQKKGKQLIEEKCGTSLNWQNQPQFVDLSWILRSLNVRVVNKPD